MELHSHELVVFTSGPLPAHGSWLNSAAPGALVTGSAAGGSDE